jgi:hypothetical protein
MVFLSTSIMPQRLPSKSFAFISYTIIWHTVVSIRRASLNYLRQQQPWLWCLLVLLSNSRKMSKYLKLVHEKLLPRPIRFTIIQSFDDIQLNILIASLNKQTQTIRTWHRKNIHRRK